MYITNITQAKAHLTALIKKVLAGEEITIGKSGKPVAKLVRYERREESPSTRCVEALNKNSGWL